ncbi:Predicted ATP-dependent endonuclease of the OLD family, contains P-loop ATPase and TOPRIM domains [Prosthecobacter debontii]|uniref:Predicted ATP-dependent endonuclease of the OLD family, contains P-loop ATPase and TOPRIM domains n=1 Tax=Prosthecobacter debontii TaxID=48467 RepID=A0A1T4Z5E5_9BACT|nr:AAA family ATPase [Prosthecobacter debontii]SKB08781.1 Predicted ATP-dependent endonuclease of the OLD family, contains P-loop ATPase and TOPRIM domains [Prosthecobacter debontii]
MRITSLTIRNFQCFGPEPTTIELDNLTAFVGMNGVGKTAILQALVRLFGSPSERRLERKDFHLPFGKNASDVDSTELTIEARIDFAEGEEGIAEYFHQMAITDVGGDLFCRVRLTGTWEKSTAAEGDIEEKMIWIKSEEENPDENSISPMSNAQRSLVQVTYVPATRDPAKQLRQVSGSVLHKLMRAVEWKEETRQAVEEACESMRRALAAEIGVTSIQNSISTAWEKLYTLPVHSKVKLRAVTSEFGDLLKNIETVFEPGESGTAAGIERLSDGMKSLFYFCLIRAAFAIENGCRNGKEEGAGLIKDDLKLASLNIFVIEEPENHLSPHYLGRIIAELKEMSQQACAQVLVTSQSAGILKRVDPLNVRHVRLKKKSQTSVVHRITLPEGEDEADAYKFVKEAVQAYPELYFSTFVILGEGDSEEIVIPKLAAVCNLNLDLGFVSMIPLGGRHVHHFWRLLNDLKIPFVTLLDLDQERRGGGWRRIKSVCDQLLLYGVDRSKLLEVEDGVLEDSEYEDMPNWGGNIDSLNAWCKDLENFDVYFSAPLDLDFLMYSAFPEAYRATGEDGPRIPHDADKREERIKKAIIATLKAENSTGETYSEDEKKEFIWYSYLFLGRGKPGTHLKALNGLDDSEIASKIPPVLKRMIEKVVDSLDVTKPEA